MSAGQNTKSVWDDKLHTEIAYWRSIISGSNPRTEWVELFRKRAGGQYPWPTNLTEFLNSDGVTRILDVGSGPHTTIGPVGVPSEVEIIAVDPLAEEYNELLDEYNIVPSTRTQYGCAETLTDHVEGRFDIVYSRNALDHSYEPLAALLSMIDCLNARGSLYLEGSVNEGVNQNYHGLHQWNFMPLSDGDFVIWNKEYAHSVQSTLGDGFLVDARREMSWYKIKIRRNISY
jgi:SAM-dependent methyltransferase